MAIRDAILSEFDNEKALERVPVGKGDWKPHEKSTSLVRLAAHIARFQ